MTIIETPTLVQDGSFLTGTYGEILDPQAADALGLQAVFYVNGLNTAVNHRYLSASLRIGIKSIVAGDVGTVFEFYVKRSATPPQWSNTFKASTYGPTVASGQRSLGLDLADGTLVACGTYKLRTSTTPQVVTIALDPAALSAASNFDTWSGAFAFQVNARRPLGSSGAIFHGNADPNRFALTLETDLRRITGYSTDRDALGRASECPVCGFTSTRDTWVRSPLTKTFVCTKNSCADPEDIPRPVGGSDRPVGINED